MDAALAEYEGVCSEAAGAGVDLVTKVSITIKLEKKQNKKKQRHAQVNMMLFRSIPLTGTTYSPASSHSPS